MKQHKTSKQTAKKLHYCLFFSFFRSDLFRKAFDASLSQTRVAVISIVKKHKLPAQFDKKREVVDGKVNRYGEN